MKVLILTAYEHAMRMTDVAHGHDIHYIVDQNYKLPMDYDIGISFMWTKRVPKEHINHRPWINFHPGPLPEYKGRNLCYHAIMNGEKEFGATVHYMDENFDTGDIIEVKKFPILPSETAEDLSNKTIAMSKALFLYYLPRILNGEIFQTIKNVGGVYYKKSKIDDVIPLGDDGEWLGKEIRAIYYPPYYPKVEIGGVTYKIVKDE